MKNDKNIEAQSTLEFTFAMIAIIFLIYGMMMVFRWTGMDLANRRMVEDSSLTVPVLNGDPSVQLNVQDDSVMPMAAMFHGSITSGNTSQ